jgi:hypothetical protein
MKFAAVLALAAGAMAMKNETVTYVTEVVTAVTTFCPGPTEVTYGGSTYTVTEVRSHFCALSGRRRRAARTGSCCFQVATSTAAAPLPPANLSNLEQRR